MAAGGATERSLLRRQFVALLSSCERALESRSELFVAFLETFRCQLKQVRRLQ